MVITLADASMKRELCTLWETCFPDPPLVVHSFFRHRFRPEQCLAARIDGKVVSALHLLPASLTTETGRCPLYYIYAAATLPEYRNAGCMTRLLKAAEVLACEREIPFTALVPSVESLFAYYQKSGFVPYFETRTVRITREELKALARGGRELQSRVSDRLLASVRTDALQKKPGNVIWNRTDFAFAARFQEISQGDVFSAAAPGAVGYALFQKVEQVDLVSELIGNEAVLPGLAYQLEKKCRGPLMFLRMPADSPLFPGQGELSFTGMLKSNSGRPLPRGEHPYLGLDLG